jgi:hypothetical protein
MQALSQERLDLQQHEEVSDDNDGDVAQHIVHWVVTASR